MKLFDLHCDTVFECEKRGCRLNDNESLHISLKKAEKYEKYVQVLAFWSDSKLTDDEAYRHFWRMLEYFRTEKLPDGFEYYLAVEGGSLLGRDLSRLDELDKAGISLFTPVWSGINAVGGAHGTDAGLTKFGEEVISRCFELGITPDISHASDRTAQSILEIAADIGRPAVATHSCCRWIIRRVGRLIQPNPAYSTTQLLLTERTALRSPEAVLSYSARKPLRPRHLCSPPIP